MIFRLSFTSVIFVFLIGTPVFDASAATQDPSGYALVLSNGSQIKVCEYAVDLEHNSVTYKSDFSGLTATFPLERLKKIVRYDVRSGEIPDDAYAVYQNNDSIADIVDDGGIPVIFKVKVSTVGSGSTGRGRSSASSRRSTSTRGRSSNTASNTSSRNRTTASSRSKTSTSSRSTTSARRTSTSASRSSTGSSNTENFFKSLFGNR